jgi:hypothetical protein
MSTHNPDNLSLNSWSVRSVWASTDFRFAQCSWPFAVFVMDEKSLSLQTRFPWDENWTRAYEEIEYVLMNGKSFFIVATDRTYGRVIGSWKLAHLVEQELLLKSVRTQRVNESLNLLLSHRKRERLSHLQLGE